MSFSRLFPLALAACAATLLVSCGGLSSSGSLMPAQASAAKSGGGHAGSWMLPTAKHGALLYVSEYGGGVVDVFSYPKGQQVGLLRGFLAPQGECVDKKGDVFILNANINHGQPSIIEFAHGGTQPIATLTDNDQDPYGCAIDPTTGNLAVSNQSGAIAIYAKAKGSPAYIADHLTVLALWCGFDNAGNLFVDGLNRNIGNEFDELVKGTSTFAHLTLSQSIGFPGNIQWDGKELTLGDALYQGNDTSAIYQLQVANKTATITGTTVLAGSAEVFGSWIQGKRVIGP